MELDLAIVGAGPAGLGAAIEAAGLGLSVVVLDEQPAPGGQVHRAIEVRKAAGRLDGEDDRDGAALVAAFRASGAVHWPSVQVWRMDPPAGGAGFRLVATQDGASQVIAAKRVLLAVGALERPAPFPGWTLPGVLTVGAAQILLKSGGNLPAAPLVIAGQGPLPLLFASQLAKAGMVLDLILDTAPAEAWRRALPHLPGALRGWQQLARGLRLMLALRRSPARRVARVREIEALGEHRLEAVRYRTKAGWAQVPATILLVHEGVIPNVQPAMSLGVEHVWDDGQACWRPKLGVDGETSVPGLFIAGDAAGIGGWRVAAIDGRLAGLRAAETLGVSIDAARRSRLRLERRPHAALRPFLDALGRPREELLAPADATVVCRCEMVTAGTVRAAVQAGATGPNEVKIRTRCGMGPCQGRLCGPSLTMLVAEARGVSPAEAGHLRIRPPLKPVTLGDMAGIPLEDRSG